jgi:ATP-dependent RNA helicase DeaD
LEKEDKIDLRVLETSQNLYDKSRSGKPSRDGEKKSFGFKGKSSFAKKNKSKPNGFTNNPKYFERKPSENTSLDSEKKSFGFKGKKKFKSRNSRPKNFSFKKHSKKRARS